MVWVAHASPELDAQSQYPAIIAICVVLSVVSMAIVGCRLYIRSAARGLASDDLMAAVSLVFALVYSILCIAQTRYGLGLALRQRPEASKVIYTRINFAGRPIYQLGISFFKVALLISYLRLLKGTDQRAYRQLVWATIVFVLLAHVGCSLSLVFACSPVAKSWQPALAGTCLPPGPSFTAYAAVTIASDIIVALLPIPVLLKLNVRLEKKLGLIGIFMLGLFTTVCSILRYLQINRIQYGDGNSTMLVLWGVIEFNVGNMVSSLPFLAPVCMKKARDYRSKYSGNGGSSSQGQASGRSGGGGRSHSDHFKLSDMSNDGSPFARSTSQELILNEARDPAKDQNDNMVKPTTFGVCIDREAVPHHGK
ncbi:hypothetical protein CDD81_7032 [Ophiocordyceps australis]|uniref:Rhodopsin domain-containing protein n=1 Tax=Ophiocordyceps australis TaxID=1399860 RepID=A0A2C5YCV9_9HYPO|nr:hypothetical protein CDD81_7032 [Ophiocordyceps australis]